jgi:hypothetical protein
LDVAGRSGRGGARASQLELSSRDPACRRTCNISGSSLAFVRSKISRCQTRTGRDHPLPGWPTSLPGHQFACFRRMRSSRCWRSIGCIWRRNTTKATAPTSHRPISPGGISRGLNLRGIKMDRAVLRGADFTGAHLQRANLIGVISQEARFDSADLSGARLSGANLVSASLQNARLAPSPGARRSK